MKYLNKIVILYLLFNGFNVVGQWGIQTGYDYGVIQLPSVNTETFTEKYSYNSIHRFTILTDYTFNNNILLAFGSGYDKYIRNKESSKKTFIEANNTCSIKNTRLNAVFNVFRFELSMGYKLRINDKLSITPKLAIESLILNDIVFNKSLRTVKLNDGGCINNNFIISETESFIDLANYESLYGYPNNKKLILPVFNISIELNQMINQFNLNYYIGYSHNDNNNRIVRGRYFLFGIRLGYSFSQKNKENEK